MKTVISLSDQEWDDLVKDTYNKRTYSLQQQNGCRDRGVVNLTIPDKYAEDIENDFVPEIVNGEEMGVSFKAWLERDPNKPLAKQEDDYELDLWWERNFYPNHEIIANDLHDKGILKAGEYIIVID